MRASIPASLLVIMGAAAPVPAQVTPPEAAELHGSAPAISASRVTGTIRVDGSLSDAAWSEATPVTSFTQRDPEEGRPVTQPTEVRILYDADALYIGARFSDAAAVST